MKKINKNLGLRKAYMFFAIFLFGGIVSTSCKKPEEDIGLAVQPQDDRLQVVFTDTLDIAAFTILEDSLRSDEFGTSLMGSNNDPVFGLTESAINLQIRMESNAPNFLSATGSVSETVVDSIILYLDLDTYYGQLTAQEFEVYEILEDFYSDTNYYSNDQLLVGTNYVDPTEATIIPNPDDNATINGESVNPNLRIKLLNSLGDKFVGQSGTNSLLENDAADGFVNFFKGIKVKSNGSALGIDEGAILYLDLINTNSKITMYYRHIKVGEQDTLQYDFLINSNSARFNSITHDYSGTQIEAQFNDTALGDQTLFVQAMAGCKVQLEMPNLTSFVDSGIVNKAELIIPFEFVDGDSYNPQSRIFIVGEDENGDVMFLDDQSEGDTHYGGFVNYTTNEYRVNISKHVNNILTGASENIPLYLISSSAAVSANRIVVNGKQSLNSNQLKFEFTYTRF